MKTATRKYGKANHRKVLQQADLMAEQAKAAFPSLPNWAGLAWIVNHGWNYNASKVRATMGAAWTARADVLCKALAIKAEHSQAKRMGL